jgi:hypothetical protein
MKMKSCSLTIVCVIFLVVILFMMFSGSNNNMYRLIEGMEPKKEGNVFTDAMSSTLSASKMLLPGGPLLAGPSGNDDEKDKKDKEDDDTTESFQVRPPHSFSDIVETKDDSWNLTTWVKNAQRYSKGMGNENKIDSYKYNAGPTIPLPEGQLFFFNNTKFDSECCPATYSSSRGCACLSQPQYNHLMMRGGNNTPPKNTNTSYFNEF